MKKLWMVSVCLLAMLLPVAFADMHEEATVTVAFSSGSFSFGEASQWEVSLYAGADVGEETSGRFTEWRSVETHSVTFSLPEDVREGNSAPFGEPVDTYVRIRSLEGAYPSFDFVSEAFTLEPGDHSIHLALSTFVTSR